MHGRRSKECDALFTLGRNVRRQDPYTITSASSPPPLPPAALPSAPLPRSLHSKYFDGAAPFMFPSFL